MGRAPAFQFYAAEYLADENVALLTLEQEGIYIRLLAYCWREGSIPADVAKLSKLCKGAAVEALAGVIELFAGSGNERLLHPRLEDERRKHEEYRLKQAENGARGGRPSKLKPDETQPKGLGLFGETQTEAKKRSSSAFASSSSSSTESRKQETSRGKRDESEIDLPGWIDREMWSDYLEVRKKKRAVMDMRALQRAVNALEKFRANGHDATKILEASVLANWVGFFELKGRTNGTSQPTPGRAAVRDEQRKRNLSIAVADRLAEGTATHDGGIRERVGELESHGRHSTELVGALGRAN